MSTQQRRNGGGEQKGSQPTMKTDANGIITGTRPTRESSPDQVRICRAFLERCERTKTGRIGSYGLKHVIERAAGEYVSNGACIQAAVDLGIVTRPIDPYNGSPNAWIGVSRRSVRRVAHGSGTGGVKLAAVMDVDAPEARIPE